MNQKMLKPSQDLTDLRGDVSMKGLTTDQDDIAMLRGRDENLQGQQELLEAEKSAGGNHYSLCNHDGSNHQ